MRRLLPAAAAVAALALAPAASAQNASQIAFTQFDESEVYVVSVAGGTAKPTYGGLLPSFSPNGAQVATITPNGAISVYSTTRNGPGKKVGTQASGGDYLNYGPAAWSPNGKQLAFTRAGDVYVVNATGGKPKKVYDDGPLDNEATHPVWSPSGRGVYFLVVNQALSAEAAFYQLMSVPTTGGKPATVAGTIPVATPSWSLTPFSLSLSPDGSTLAVTLAQRGDATNNGAGPYTATAVGLWPTSGGTVTVLPGFSAPAWAPGGGALCAEPTGGGLSIITPTGTVTSTPVAAGTEATACAWVP